MRYLKQSSVFWHSEEHNDIKIIRDLISLNQVSSIIILYNLLSHIIDFLETLPNMMNVL